MNSGPKGNEEVLAEQGAFMAPLALIESGITPWVGPEAQRRKLATNRKK
jgi:hypothetical protein